MPPPKRGAIGSIRAAELSSPGLLPEIRQIQATFVSASVPCYARTTEKRDARSARPAQNPAIGQAGGTDRSAAYGGRTRDAAHGSVARAGSRQADAVALHCVRG